MSPSARPRWCSRITYAATRPPPRALEEEGEGILERGTPPRRDCILRSMRRRTSSGRFAERELRGVDDVGGEERIVIWIERKPGALWAVGRAVNPQHRRAPSRTPTTGVFEGFELDDALEAANAALEDDVSVLEGDRNDVKVKPFTRREVLPRLERWFFGRGS